MKMSYEQLKGAVANIITKAKLSNASFVETRNNVVGLIDKVGKVGTLDSVFVIDKLAFMDGEYLPFGKTIEEWSADLILPIDHDATGANALAPHPLTFRPVFYSYTLGRKVIAVSIPNNDIERAVNSESEFASVVAIHTKRLEDSKAVYRYALKRELIAKAIALVEEALDYSTATAVGSITTSTAVGTIMKNSTTNIGILVKKYVSGNKDWATLTADGTIIEYDLVRTIAKPVDTSKGEAFLKQVKSDIEIAKDLSEGHSLNGNSLGATEGLVLIVRQGIIPSLEVDTFAGAFNKGDLDIKVETEVIRDFGGASAKYYAILMDKRALRLFNTYNAVRENMNGEGDFLNLFAHTEDTGAMSRNVFFRVYKDEE